MTCSQLAHHTPHNPHYNSQRVRRTTLAVTLLAVTALVAFTAPRASAISDAEELTRFGGQGSGAGELSSPAGIATDPVTGHLYTTEPGNSRISEFTPWGNFVKAFGWNVAPGAVNEQQEVRVRASAGQFKLTFGASTTSDLAFNAPGSASEGAGSVEAALNALASIGGAGGEVNVQAVPAPPDGKTPTIYVVAFKGSLAATNVDELTIANGTTQLSGGVPTTSLEVRTRADGTAGGVGLESCTAESGCKAGLAGAGAGQFANAQGVAVDTAGNVYVKDLGNLRVQKFDSAGRYVLMFGGEVNETNGEDICTFASGDQCGAGAPGTDPGQFSGSSRSVSLGSSGQLFVADKDRIQRFNLQGEFEASIPVPGEQVEGLAFDPLSEDLYATYSGEGGVHKLDSVTGAEIGEPRNGDVSVATDTAGNLFVSSEGRVLQYDSAGKPLSPPSCCEAEFLPPPNPAVRFGLSALGTNAAGTLYVAYSGGGFSGPADSFIRVFGPGPVIFEAPPPVAPTISAQFATSVERTGAVLSAEINPHFWSDTRFYVQYGEGKCSEGGCTAEKPLPPGALLGTKAVDAVLKSTGIFLEGLKPGTTYHYRFVAVSLGGGPVRGVGGEVGVDGEESSFTTYPAQSPYKADCQNQQFRTGFSAPLPDCRAFEMVSPIDKNNGDIKVLLTAAGLPTALTQSSIDGNRFTYTASRAFADPKAGPYAHQYMVERSEGVGWQSESLMPPQGAASVYPLGILDSQYKAFSDDLCDGWLVAKAEPPLVPQSLAGYENLLHYEGCGSKGFDSLVGVAPTVTSGNLLSDLQGISADGEEAILQVNDKLTPEAASGRWQTYYASNGQLHLICILPSGSPSPDNCSGGTSGSVGVQWGSRTASVIHALSVDGSRAYWTASTDKEGPGKVYLRLNPGAEQSAVSGGECTEAEKACTLKVSETASTKPSQFLGASSDGARALFEVIEGAQAGNLYLFDMASGESALIAKKVGQPGEQPETFFSGLLGASEDLSRVYFVSEEALGGGAQAGRPNLYLSEEGVLSFIATLSDANTAPQAILSLPTNTSPQPMLHASRVSPDGGHIAFISAERLSGYDNTDQVTGEADSEVYLYEAGSAGPVCVSCNPSGARPIGREIKLFPSTNPAGRLRAAATIPVAQFNLRFSRSLSVDGSHLFFNSFDALLPRDTNGKADVYQWQAASGANECKAKGAELYVESSGGCLSLISSGQSPTDSEFLDASPSAEDVFFTTQASLLPEDPGLIDVYDARAKGGLPGPPEPPGPCQGEACQIAPPPPNDPTPASASFKGAGNLRATPRCRKGKVARKGRCVAKKRKAAKRHAKRETNRNRGANR